MTISNLTLPNLQYPGAVQATPLTGYEIVPISAGPVSNFTTVAGLADSSIVDQTVTALGTNRATAYVIIGQITNVTTASASTGVVLNAATKPGMKRVIYNNGANPIKVYANGSDTIDTVAGATGVTLTNALRCQFTCVAVGVWISAQLGVISA